MRSLPAPAPTDSRDDRLGRTAFADIAQLVESCAGIRLPPTKRDMLEGRLRRRLRAHGFTSFDPYHRLLLQPAQQAVELPHLIDAVTTNTTDFFREPEHFDYLRTTGVPGLLARRSNETRPHLKVWSAASSTGAEAYTLAMVLAGLAAEGGRPFTFAVLATDIALSVLEVGRRAVYPASMAASIPPAYARTALQSGRTVALRDQVRIVPALRAHVNFAPLNLMDPTYPVDRDVDIIFLRNVLIYFDRPVQDAVVRRIALHLRPGGLLVLGHSESMIGNATPLRQVAPAIFAKPEAAHG